MSRLRISPDLFLGTVELNRMIQFLDDDGWRKMFIENIATPGISFRNRQGANDNFNSFLVSKSDNPSGRYIKINPGLAIDGSGRVITNPINLDSFDPSSVDGLRRAYTSQDTGWAGTYLIKVRWRGSFDEVAPVSISNAEGSITGTDLHKILRGMSNVPSVVRFPYSTVNRQEYEVSWVSANGLTAQLSGNFIPEANVMMRVRGSFTFGHAPPEVAKYPFQYDSCEIFSSRITDVAGFQVASEITANEFPLALVTIAAGENATPNLTVTDLRNACVFQTKQDADTFLWNFVEGDGIVGVESIHYTPLGTARDQNIVQIGWGIRSDNWTFNSGNNKLTINSIKPSGRIKSITGVPLSGINTYGLNTNLLNKLVGWRVYLQDGVYSVITGVSYNSGESFDLTISSSKAGDFAPPFAGAELVIVPPADTVNFLIKPIPSGSGANIISGREVTVSAPIFKGYLRVPLYVHPAVAPTTNYKVQYSYSKGTSFLKWREMQQGAYYDADQYYDDGSSFVVNPVLTPYSGQMPIRLKESPDSFRTKFGEVSNGDNLEVKILKWRTRNALDPIANGVNNFSLTPGVDEHEMIIQPSGATFMFTENIYINLVQPSKDGTTWTFEFKGKFDLQNSTTKLFFGLYFVKNFTSTASVRDEDTVFKIVPDEITSPQGILYARNKYFRQQSAPGQPSVDSHFRIRFVFDLPSSTWNYFIYNPYIDTVSFKEEIEQGRTDDINDLIGPNNTAYNTLKKLKDYADLKLPLAGGTMTGPLKLAGDAVDNDDAVQWEQVKDAFLMKSGEANSENLNTFFRPGIYSINNTVGGPAVIPANSPGMLEVKLGYFTHEHLPENLTVTQTLYFFFPNSGGSITQNPAPTPVNNTLIRSRIFSRTIFFYNNAAFHPNQWMETTNTDSLQSKGYIYNNDLNLVLKQGTYQIDSSSSDILNGPTGIFPAVDTARSMLLVSVAYVTGSADVPNDSVITQTLWCPTRVSSGNAAMGVTRMFTRSIHWLTSGGSFQLHAAQWNEVVLWDKFKNAFINKTGWFNLDLNTIKSPGTIQLGNFTNGPLEIDGSNIPNKLSNLSVFIGFLEDGSKLIKQVLSQPSDATYTPADQSYSRIWMRTMMVDTPATDANQARNHFHQNQWVEMLTSKSFVKDALIMREKQADGQDLATFTKTGTFNITDIVGGPDGIERFTPGMLEVKKAYFDDTHSDTNVVITQRLNLFFPNMGVPAPNPAPQWVSNSIVRTRIFERTIMIFNGAQFHQKQWTEVTNFNALETKRGLPEANSGFLAPITTNGTNSQPVNDLNWVLAQGIYTFDQTTNNPNRIVETPFSNTEGLDPAVYGWTTLVVQVGYYRGGNYTNPRETTITQTLYYPMNFNLGDATKVRTRMFVRSIPWGDNTLPYQFNKQQWVEMADASKCLMFKGVYTGNWDDLRVTGFYSAPYTYLTSTGVKTVNAILEVLLIDNGVTYSVKQVRSFNRLYSGTVGEAYCDVRFYDGEQGYWTAWRALQNG